MRKMSTELKESYFIIFYSDKTENTFILNMV